MPISNQIPSSRLIQPGVVDSAATRPASPFEGQCIFQKDTDQVLFWSGTAWVETASMLTKAPRGIMGYASITTALSGITSTTVDLAGSSVTFTAQTGRLYKATWLLTGSKNAAGLDSTLVLFTNSSNTAFATIYVSSPSGVYNMNLSGSTVFTVDSGSVTYKLRMASYSGTFTPTTSSTIPLQLIIEDIGPA